MGEFKTRIDRTGQTYGRLVVVEAVEKPGSKRAWWRCRCVCGKECVVDSTRLIASAKGGYGCGCSRGGAKDLLGKRFGKLVVLERAERNASGKIRWRCLCDCGRERVVIGTLLTTGKVVSCGCEKSDKMRLYQIWADMLARCENERIRCWKHYGGKGISVCEAWHKYSVFEQWAKENGYASSLTLDRVNSDEGYYPENCRWVSLYDNQMTGLKKSFVNNVINKRWLSNEDIYYILQHRDVPAKVLAKKFNKCQQTIRNVWCGITKPKEE